MESPENSVADLSRNELIYGIREAIGVRITGTAATIEKERPRRIVATIEFMEDDDLRLLLPLSQHARQLSLLEPYALRSEGSDTGPFTGEDCYYLQDALYGGRTAEILMLARAYEQPLQLHFREALRILDNVRQEMFPLDTPELVKAHLIAGDAAAKKVLEYRSYLMMLVNMHPDKVKTIIMLLNSMNRIPTHRDVMLHHEVEPALFSGVL